MKSVRFILIENQTHTLHITPQISAGENGPCARASYSEDCILSMSELISLFHVRNLDSFRQSYTNASQCSRNPLKIRQDIADISTLDIKRLKEYPADRYFFIIDCVPIPAPECWDGSLNTFYELVSNMAQIAQAVNKLSSTEKNTATVYEQVLPVPNSVLDTIDGYLNATCEEEYQDEDNTITYTAKFPDGKEMDIKCCGCQVDPSWTEAVLFDSQGYQLTYTEPSEEYSGRWELEYGGIKYVVDIVPSDRDCTKVPKDEERILSEVDTWFAVTRWAVEDVIAAAGEQGVTLSFEQATKWWKRNERRFQDLMVERGNEILADMDFDEGLTYEAV